LFVQLFRNKIYENRRLKYRIKRLESFIASNLTLLEPVIVKRLADLWNKEKDIDLGHFHFGGTRYKLFVEFYQLVTHGAPYITVGDKVFFFPSKDPEYVEYKTEYGDLVFIVDYWLEDVLLARRASILQTKKEKGKNKVDIKLHQQYLMQFWPPVEFTLKAKDVRPRKVRFCFPAATADIFSFYHFILNCQSGSPYSSSICSAHFVGEALKMSRWNVQRSIANWVKKKKVHPRANPPSRTLSIPLVPGGIYRHGKYYKWNLLVKPFAQFILDAAYLHVGTEQNEMLHLAFLKERLKESVILAMKVVGGREGREFRHRLNDIYEYRRKKGSAIGSGDTGTRRTRYPQK